jgi:hypothetical protein
MRPPFWQRLGKADDAGGLPPTPDDYGGSVEDLEAKISRMLGGDDDAPPGEGGAAVDELHVSLPPAACNPRLRACLRQDLSSAAARWAGVRRRILTQLLGMCLL